MIIGDVPVPDGWMISSSLQGGINNLWEKRIEAAKKYFRGDGTGGPVTIFMDEPESYLSIPMQVRLWQLLGETATRYDNLQVIVSTHSPFALGVGFANYIELEKGYLAECLVAVTK